MPARKKFRRTVEGDYKAVKPGEVIDGWHIKGQLITSAGGVIVRNTLVDGGVSKVDGGAARLTLVDSTIGPAEGCVIGPAVDTSTDSGGYTAVRVHLRGHDDGFRAGGPDITIRDSFVQPCVGDARSHGDGIQDYPAAQRLTVDHTTFDMCEGWARDRSRPGCTSGAYPGINGGIFIYSRKSKGQGSSDVTVTDNLVIGGLYGIWLEPNDGVWIVRGNRVVDGTWQYGPYQSGDDGQCRNVRVWQDNTVVTMDETYTVTGTVRTEPCPG
ncbi:hypothetical protein [Actinocorallia lasiicapitis]